jgi:hypothetical protein
MCDRSVPDSYQHHHHHLRIKFCSHWFQKNSKKSRKYCDHRFTGIKFSPGWWAIRRPQTRPRVWEASGGNGPDASGGSSVHLVPNNLFCTTRSHCQPSKYFATVIIRFVNLPFDNLALNLKYLPLDRQHYKTANWRHAEFRGAPEMLIPLYRLG